MHFEAEEFERFRLTPGDVLLNEGQTPELLGRPAIHLGKPQDCAFTNSLIRFQAGIHVLPKWALLVFRAHMHSGRFTRESRITTNIAHLSLTRLRSVEMPVPPLDEQQRIVSVLEDHLSRLEAGVAYLLAGQRRMRAWRQGIRDAQLQAHALKTCRLAELVERVEAGRSSGGAAPPATPEEWGVLRVSSMTWGEFRPGENKAVPAGAADPRWEVRKGDVLVSRANTSNYVGAPVLVPDVRPRLLLSDKSLRLVPAEGVNPAWLVEALASTPVRRQISNLASGTKDSMRNISQANLLGLRLPGADAAGQSAVVEAAELARNSAERLLGELRSAQKRAAGLRRSLLSAAYSGRL